MKLVFMWFMLILLSIGFLAFIFAVIVDGVKHTEAERMVKKAKAWQKNQLELKEEFDGRIRTTIMAMEEDCTGHFIDKVSPPKGLDVEPTIIFAGIPVNDDVGTYALIMQGDKVLVMGGGYLVPNQLSRPKHLPGSKFCLEQQKARRGK